MNWPRIFADIRESERPDGSHYGFRSDRRSFA